MKETIKKYKISYTQVSNQILCDKNLSLKAKGLYGYLFSKPDDWQFHIKCMQEELQESETQIRSIIKELVDKGYIIRHQVNENGKFGGIIYEFVNLDDRVPILPHTVKTAYGKTSTHNNTDKEEKTRINYVNTVKSESAPVFDPEYVKTEWNTIAKKINLAEIRSMTPERIRKLKLRLKEQNMTIEQFFKEIKIAFNESTFLKGKKWHVVPGHPEDNYMENTEWRADFDFFLQPSSLQKAIEGKYADPMLKGKFH